MRKSSRKVPKLRERGTSSTSRLTTRSQSSHARRSHPDNAPKCLCIFHAFRWSFPAVSYINRTDSREFFSWPQTLLWGFELSRRRVSVVVIDERAINQSLCCSGHSDVWAKRRRVNDSCSRSISNSQEEPKQNSELLHVLVIFTVSSKPSINAARPWCRFRPASRNRRPQSPLSCIRELRNLCSVDLLRPAHASVHLRIRVDPCRLHPLRSCFDPNSSPKIFDKLSLCSTRGSCFQRTSSLSRQNSRSFQGSFWFLQFSRPFQDLENGFWNSSTFQGFQGPYAPCILDVFVSTLMWTMAYSHTPHWRKYSHTPHWRKYSHTPHWRKYSHTPHWRKKAQAPY